MRRADAVDIPVGRRRHDCTHRHYGMRASARVDQNFLLLNAVIPA